MSNLEMPWIVFGLSSDSRPHAAKFGPDDAELAQKAASLMGYQAIPADTPEAAKLAEGITAGRVYATGKAFAPFTSQVVYEQLLKLLPRDAVNTADQEGAPSDQAVEGSEDASSVASTDVAGEGTTEPPSPTPSDGYDGSPTMAPTASTEATAKSLWDGLKEGSEVLSTAAGEPGWWPAYIIDVSRGGKMLTLRWKGYPDEPAFAMPRTRVALLQPGQKG